MNTYIIHFWHGMLPIKLREKLRGFCEWSEENGSYDYKYTGSIDDFLAKWELNVIIYSQARIIGVTQHSSFSAR